MLNIKPLARLTQDEVCTLAHAAADRGDPIETANPFPPDLPAFVWFQTYYRDRHDELSPA